MRDRKSYKNRDTSAKIGGIYHGYFFIWRKYPNPDVILEKHSLMWYNINIIMIAVNEVYVMSNLIAKEYKCFEDIKHIDKNGMEYWNARELAIVLDYSKWENFHKVIKRAMISCETSNNKVSDHFLEFRKIVDIESKTKRETIDFHLTRYACYLIVQNANPRKK